MTDRERRNRDHLVWFIEQMTYYAYPGRLADIRKVTGTGRRNEARVLLRCSSCALPTTRVRRPAPP